MRLNDALKALADPTRREILRRLRHEGELSAGRLAERFDMTKPTLSHHFAVLKEADLIKSRRAGQQILYSLNTTVVEDVLGLLLDWWGTEGNQPSDGTGGKRGERT
ncbi:MAG TPA: autorepressor SdpR family transcription factor [Gemmatales bacterium]|nr:autorepressor SdpR family transcription factor [Gemmatales bacterium]HMP60975.1 autorepressor SdpR family transcription factor [Gemmatales bacterium]